MQLECDLVFASGLDDLVLTKNEIALGKQSAAASSISQKQLFRFEDTKIGPSPFLTLVCREDSMTSSTTSSIPSPRPTAPPQIYKTTWGEPLVSTDKIPSKQLW